jgi:hypothetical protein
LVGDEALRHGPASSQNGPRRLLQGVRCSIVQTGSGKILWDGARARFSDAEVDAAKSVGPILSIFALIPVFWALFDQTFSTWVLQGEDDRLPVAALATGMGGAGLNVLFAVLVFPVASMRG